MQPDPVHDQQRADLSSLMDGDPAASDGACRAWRADARARADWHAYHLIGDLLRSEDHRCDADHDARFVARLRERLVREPAVLAPSPLPLPSPVRSRRPRAWMAPAAVAAGFAAVAGVLVATRVPAPDAAAPIVADARSSAPAVEADGGRQPPPAVDAGSVALVRNAELDRYLAAHREYALPLAAPAVGVHKAAAAAAGR